jgi:hypothetical protein
MKGRRERGRNRWTEGKKIVKVEMVTPDARVRLTMLGERDNRGTMPARPEETKRDMEEHVNQGTASRDRKEDV